MPDQNTNHPWSSSPAAQAAVRRAEGDPGPAIQHRDLPEAFERLAERVRALESVIPKSVSGSDEKPLESKGDNMRTERVTLEITHGSLCNASGWVWGDGLRLGFPLAPVKSVRVAPTPGPGLTAGDRNAIEWALTALQNQYPLTSRDLQSLLARDAAARESGSSGPELGSELGSEVARLTAERDAALARAADAERALEAESTARAQAVAELEAARAAPTPEDASELERVLRMLPDAVASMNHGDPVEGPQINAADCVRWAIQEIERLRASVAELKAAPPTPRVVRLRPVVKGWTQMQVVQLALDAAGVAWEMEE